MTLRDIIPLLVVGCYLPRAAAQAPLPRRVPEVAPSVRQDFSATVVPISEIRINVRLNKKRIVRPSTNPISYLGLDVGGSEATGFCLDPECRFIGTNYHITLVGTPRKIKGQRVVQKYLATGPNDEGGSLNEGAKYNLSRDLAIFELRHALPNHHGIGFNLDDLELGQGVDIYAYPKEGINPFRHLLQFPGTFKGKTTKGLLAFDYSLADGKAIQRGTSGGIVVDRKTQQIVAILNAVAKGGELTAYGVPVQALADFVSRVQPYLAERLFPHPKIISPLSADLYPKFVWPPRDDPSHHRPEESHEVSLLRVKAQALVDGMKNFIAVQTFEWGSGLANTEPSALAAYEIQLVDGHQRYCDYPHKRWCTQDNAPFPSPNSYVPAAEWSDLPKVVGTDLRLKIHQAPDALLNERTVKVFQWESELEDEICGWRSIYDFVLFRISAAHPYACYGEVWTDEETNILRISAHYEDKQEKDYNGYAAIVTYGWLKLEDQSPRLVPLTISTKADHKRRVRWCRGLFTDYRVFDSRVRIVPYASETSHSESVAEPPRP